MAVTIIHSSYTVGTPQLDGRCWVAERHETSDGRVLTNEWLGDPDVAGQVLAGRSEEYNVLLQQQADVEALLTNTKLPMTKLEFRELFTTAERQAIDKLHDTFREATFLTDAQKDSLRTGLEDYKMATYVRRPFDARVASMLGLYQALGILTSARVAEVIAAGG